MKQLIPAAAYARVSTDHQVEDSPSHPRLVVLQCWSRLSSR
ncbi:hypothetical protein [Aminomonas paucivorans]